MEDKEGFTSDAEQSMYFRGAVFVGRVYFPKRLQWNVGCPEVRRESRGVEMNGA